MTDYRTVLEHDLDRVGPADFTLDDVARRRDRKRRNQRIAAGVVGIAVFVAAIWIVTSVGSFDRTQTPAVPGPAETGPTVTGPTETGPTGTGPMVAVGPVPKTDYLLDLDTGVMTPLPESIAGIAGNGGSEYAASPDGSRLAYSAGDSGHQIFVANLDGTGVEQVTHDLEAAYSPAWSPDSSKIAFIGFHDDRLQDLFVLDLATGASTQLTFATHEPDPAAPDWSPWSAWLPSFTPDGTSIVYGATRGDNVGQGESGMRIVPVAGGESVRLMEGVEEAELSPNGSLLTYRTEGSCREVYAGTAAGVCLANVDGTDMRMLVYGGRDAIPTARWSPDGTRIAYYTFHAEDVFVVDVATGRTTHVGEGNHPTWLDNHTLIIEMHDCYDPSTGGRSGCLG